MPKKDEHNPLALEPFEGEAITEIGLDIPRAGGGFQKPLDVDPTLIDLLKDVKAGETVYVTMELVKRDCSMKRAVNHDGWKRVDHYTPIGVAVVDQDLVFDAIQTQRDRVDAILQEQEDAAANLIAFPDVGEKPVNQGAGNGQ